MLFYQRNEEMLMFLYRMVIVILPSVGIPYHTTVLCFPTFRTSLFSSQFLYVLNEVPVAFGLGILNTNPDFDEQILVTTFMSDGF